MSSSGSEQACTLSDGLTQNPFSRIARSAWSMIISLRLNLGRRMTSSYSAYTIAADAKLCCGPGKHHHKGPSGQTLGLQQRGNQNIGV